VRQSSRNASRRTAHSWPSARSALVKGESVSALRHISCSRRGRTRPSPVRRRRCRGDPRCQITRSHERLVARRQINVLIYLSISDRREVKPDSPRRMVASCRRRNT
jgi:hypothetical protein